MEQGWIKLHRCLLEHPLWRNGTPEQKVVLVTLLLMANHAPRQWEWQGRPYECQPGQMVTSIRSIRKKCGKGIGIRNIRTALERFQNFGFLDTQTSRHNSLITLCNWERYQNNPEGIEPSPDTRLTHDRHTPDTRLTTNKNGKNEKNEKKREGAKRVRFAAPTLEEIQSGEIRVRRHALSCRI